MAPKSASNFLMIFALLAFASLFGVSTAFGGRKALAPAPSPDDSGVDSDTTGLAPLPADLGFTPLDSRDPKVSELATFAVGEYNKANNAKLVLSHVLEAISTTKAQATYYGLAILATNDKDLNSYLANISVANGVMTVTSFSEAQ